jgi:hypothetical protein
MASAELRKAVEDACRGEAETYEGEIIRDLILSEFVVVACRQGWQADGEPVAQVFVIPDGGPEHRIVGLLDEALKRYRVGDLPDL